MLVGKKRKIFFLALSFMEALWIEFSSVKLHERFAFVKFTHKMYIKLLMAWKKSHLAIRKIKFVTKFSENNSH